MRGMRRRHRQRQRAPQHSRPRRVEVGHQLGQLFYGQPLLTMAMAGAPRAVRAGQRERQAQCSRIAHRYDGYDGLVPLSLPVHERS